MGYNTFIEMKRTQLHFATVLVALGIFDNCLSSPINSCLIKIFDEENFAGEFLATNKHNGLSHVHIHEKSIQTFGACCWRLFTLKGHRGESQILRGNRDFPSSDNWSWNPGDVKSVRKCDSCQKCSRHNKTKRRDNKNKRKYRKRPYL